MIWASNDQNRNCVFSQGFYLLNIVNKAITGERIDDEMNHRVTIHTSNSNPVTVVYLLRQLRLLRQRLQLLSSNLVLIDSCPLLL